MSWAWHWGIFIMAIIPCIIVVQFSRGAINTSNVVRYEASGDWRAASGGAIIGSILAGALYAAVITAIAGFMF
jgi:hypothetical protein